MYRKTLIFATIILLSLGASSCYRAALQQGNMVTPETVAQLRVGMSQADVHRIMGTPLLHNTFRRNRWEYVYTLLPKRSLFALNKKYQQRKVIIYFSHDRVSQIIQEGIEPPKTEKPAEAGKKMPKSKNK
jgi:outer membrane protein assembly factor BamE